MPTSVNRTFESRAAAPAVRLAGTPKAPALEEITPQGYARLSPAQKKEMVDKLIDFLKSI